MIKQNLAIYSIPILYKILKELEKDLNYNTVYISDKKKFANVCNYSLYIFEISTIP